MSWPIEQMERCGNSCQPAIGKYVRPDEWFIGGRLEASDWDEAAFRLPTNSGGPITSLAVNVKVTGRVVRKDQGSEAVRAQIEFVGDCEPSTFVNGWLHI